MRGLITVEQKRTSWKESELLVFFFLWLRQYFTFFCMSTLPFLFFITSFC